MLTSEELLWLKKTYVGSLMEVAPIPYWHAHGLFGKCGSVQVCQFVCKFSINISYVVLISAINE